MIVIDDAEEENIKKCISDCPHFVQSMYMSELCPLGAI